MSLRLPYKSIDNFLKSEAFEPRLNWGLRMAITSVVPLVYGIATGNNALAEWMTLTAQSIAWVELKGSPGVRVRVLFAGIIIAIIFALLGSYTANSIPLSILGMFVTGAFASLCRNLGDRGNGLATTVFILFIICNAYPAATTPILEERLLYIFLGGVWCMVAGMVASAFVPEREPYRRSLAVIWKSIALLINTVSKGWDGETVRSNTREIYLKERDVRAALDSSFHFYTEMAHQVTKKDQPDYQLAQTRKTTSLVAAHVLAMSEELESLNYKTIDQSLRLRLYTLFRAIQQACDRMAVYVLTLKPEELTLLNSRIERVRRLIAILNEVPVQNDKEKAVVARIIQLSERTVRLVESGIGRLEKMGEDMPIYRSYSLMKTLYILHPRYLFRNLKLLFNFNSFTVRYALRNALAASFATFLFKYFKIDHGYWLPLTVLIVAQPYFGATFQKAIDRMAGTIIGGLTASLLLHIPDYLSWMGFARLPFGVVQAIVLFICCVMMVYYLRKKYSYTTFFVTIWLVFLFAYEKVNMSPLDLVLVRGISTLGGSLIAVIAGFALLPAWDSKLLPENLAEAISANYAYFLHCFFGLEKTSSWTKYKKDAETDNSNVFDSYSRFIQEPNADKRLANLYFQILTHNIRITRELNNYQIEDDAKTEQQKKTSPAAGQEECIKESMNRWTLLREKANALLPLTGKKYQVLPDATQPIAVATAFTNHQSIYLDKLNIELKAMRQEIERLEKELQS